MTAIFAAASENRDAVLSISFGGLRPSALSASPCLIATITGYADTNEEVAPTAVRERMLCAAFRVLTPRRITCIGRRRPLIIWRIPSNSTRKLFNGLVREKSRETTVTEGCSISHLIQFRRSRSVLQYRLGMGKLPAACIPAITRLCRSSISTLCDAGVVSSELIENVGPVTALKPACVRRLRNAFHGMPQKPSRRSSLPLSTAISLVSGGTRRANRVASGVCRNGRAWTGEPWWRVNNVLASTAAQDDGSCMSDGSSCVRAGIKTGRCNVPCCCRCRRSSGKPSATCARKVSAESVFVNCPRSRQTSSHRLHLWRRSGAVQTHAQGAVADPPHCSQRMQSVAHATSHNPPWRSPNIGSRRKSAPCFRTELLVPSTARLRVR
jgi:hypothetical protein